MVRFTNNQFFVLVDKWGGRKGFPGSEGFLADEPVRIFKVQRSCERASSGRVQACLPSVFGESLTAMCGKSNKNGEQRFLCFLKQGCLF